MGRTRWLLLAAVALGIALRLLFAFGFWIDKPLTQDEREYLLLGENLSRGRGFSYGRTRPEGTTQHFSRAPLYPLFVSTVMRATRGFGGTNRTAPPPRPVESVPAPLKLTQALLGGVIVWLIARWAARAADGRAGIAAACVAAIYPPLVWMPAYALTETLFSAFALASALLITLASEQARRNDGSARGTALQLMLFGGLLAGLATLTRSAILLSLAFVFVWLVLRRQFLLLGTLILAMAIVIAPWTVRNVRQYGRFVLVAADGGVTFWTGNNRLAHGEGDMASNPDVKRANLELRARYPGLTAEALEPMYYREALGDIARDPVWWCGLLARKLFYTIVPIGPSYTEHSALYFGGSVASYGLVLPFAVAGFVALGARRSRLMGLWCLALGSLLVSLAFFPQERFRIPIVDPTLVVCAGVWIGARVSGGQLATRGSR